MLFSYIYIHLSLTSFFLIVDNSSIEKEFITVNIRMMPTLGCKQHTVSSSIRFSELGKTPLFSSEYTGWCCMCFILVKFNLTQTHINVQLPESQFKPRMDCTI